MSETTTLRDRWRLYRWLDAYRGLGWLLGALVFLGMALWLALFSFETTTTWHQIGSVIALLLATCLWFYRWTEEFLGVQS